MNALQIKNKIDTYNMNVQTYQTKFLEFDFQNFFKTDNQLTSLMAYAVMQNVAPLNVIELKTFSAYNTITSVFSNHVNGFYSDKYHVSDLLNMMESYEEIPERYHCLLEWKPDPLQIELIHKVLAEYELFAVYGKERLTQYMNDYLDAVLAKSLPNMKEEDIRGLIGVGHLTEEKIRSFEERDLLPDKHKIIPVYEALGMEIPKTVSKSGIKIVGVNFKSNETGTPRQELLQALNESQETEEITLLPCIYKKEGHPDTQAVAVMWNGQDIGNLSQATVDAIYNEFDQPEFKVREYEIIGGQSANYSFGLKLSFDITGKEKIKEEIQTQSMTMNPMNI